MRRVVVGGALLAGLALGSGFAYQHFFRPPEPPPPDAQELQRLELERQSLQQRLLELTGKDAGFTSAPTGRLLIGVPTGFVTSLVEQTLTGLLGQLEVKLRRLKVRKADVVKARTPLGVVKLGDFSLDLTIHEIQGVLTPGTPELRFGGEGVGVELPVTLASGEGRASLRLRWTGHKLAGAACGDVDVKRDVAFSLVPVRWRLDGQFVLQASGDSVVATPRFDDTKLKVRVEPSAATWKLITDLIAQQSSVCRKALKAADVSERLRALLGRGFDVTLPARVWRPIRLPAGLTQSIEVPGRGSVRLAVKPIGLTIAPQRLWYGADVELARLP